MFVALESYVFDPVGAIVLNATPDSELSASTRRVSRTATLDGNAALIDNGWTAADSTLTIEAHLTPAEEATIQRLIRVYPEVVCSTDNGCYLGVIETFRRVSSGRFVISFLIQRDMTQEAQVTDNDIPGPVVPTYTLGWLMATDTDGPTYSTPWRYWSDTLTEISLPATVDGAFDWIAADGAADALLFHSQASSGRSYSWTDDGGASLTLCGETDFDGSLVRGGGSDTDGAWLWGTSYIWTASTLATDTWTQSGFTYPVIDAALSAVIRFNSRWVVAHSFGTGTFPYTRRTLKISASDDLTVPVETTLRADFPVSADVETTDSDTETWRSSQYFAATDDRLVLVNGSGRFRYSADGLVWSADAAIADDVGRIDAIAAGSGYFVAVGTRGEPVIYIADATTLIWQAYTVPDISFAADEGFQSVAHNHGTFAVGGSNSVLVTFTEPDSFTVDTLAFGPAASIIQLLPISEQD